VLTDKQKIEKYESLLHALQLSFDVVMDSERVERLLRNISMWSYAHRSGNGMLSEEEQDERIEGAFHKLLD